MWQLIEQDKTTGKFLFECDCGIRQLFTKKKRYKSIECHQCRFNRKTELLKKQFLGKKINSWTVTEYIGKGKNGVRRWKCICECGSKLEVNINCISKNEITKCRSCFIKERYETSGQDQIHQTWWSCFLDRVHKSKMRVYFTKEEAYNLYLKQNKKCALSGLPLYFKNFNKESDDRLRSYNASIDRKNSSKEYTLDNIQFIDKRINIMKNNQNENIFKELCSRIAKHSPIKYDEDKMPPDIREERNPRKGRISIKKYKLTDPEGNVHFTTHGLAQFCREHNLCSDRLSALASGREKYYRGWQAEKIK